MEIIFLQPRQNLLMDNLVILSILGAWWLKVLMSFALGLVFTTEHEYDEFR